MLDVVGDGAPLEPGLYTHGPFRPGVTFQLDDGWEGGHTHDRFFDVWQGEEMFVGFVVPRFLALGGGRRRAAAGLRPGEAADLISRRPGLSVSRPVPARVGGAPGVRVEVRADRRDVGVLGIDADGTVSSPPGWFVRWSLIEVERTLVVAMVGMRGGRDPAALARAQVVLDSVRWGPPAAEIEPEGRPLRPGRYTHPPFVPPVSFEVGEGWDGGHLLAEFFDVQRDGLLLGFANPAFLVSPNGREVAMDRFDRRSAARMLARTAGLAGSTLWAGRVGGARGTGIDLEITETSELWGGPEGRFSTQEGSFLRLVVLSLRGELVLTVIQQSHGRDEAELALADEVLRTVRWG